MDWADRRRLSYIALLFLVLGTIGYLGFRQVTGVAPTCYDTRKNGDEVGVDCGGSCSQYCANELSSPKIRWVRTFQITPSVAQSVAYIEHSNTTAASALVGYTFKLYDAKNTLIVERSGTTFLGPMGRTAIVETLIPTGNTPVARTTITFAEPIVWQKIPPAFSQVAIKTDRTLLENYTYGNNALHGTRLTATLENTSRYAFTSMDVIAVLYDKDDNAITASKVLLPNLPALGAKTITFTWPFTLPAAAVRTEIIPRFNPFTTELL